jgi:hypothetical protein
MLHTRSMMFVILKIQNLLVLLKSNILSISHFEKGLDITSFRSKILGCLQLSSL